MDNKKNIIEDLYKSTFIVFLMSMMATTVGNFIDGVIIGKNLGADAMAAFGFFHTFTKINNVNTKRFNFGDANSRKSKIG